MAAADEAKRRALAGCVLFEGIEEATLRALAAAAELRRYAPGEPLFRQGEAARGFFVVAGGTVNVHRVGADGREQVLHLFGPGEAVGEVPVFEGGDFPADAVASGRATALFLPRAAFLRCARAQPALLLNMLAALSRRLRRFVDLVDDLALKDVGARLAQHLLRLAGDGAASVELPVSKALLASQLGTIAETLSRTFRKLEQRGLLRVEGRRIRLVDRDGLEALAAEGRLA